MTQKLNLIGQRFGRLVVCREAESNTHGQARWQCTCDCGSATTVLAVLLRQNKAQSCGCLRRELGVTRGRASKKHGESTHNTASTADASPEYRCWGNMLSRCNNANHVQFRHYGARGIKVCDSWTSFENFLADMGRRPDKFHSLDRIDNNAGYSPDNCRWATRTVQNSNRRPNTTESVSVPTEVTINGETLTTKEWLAKAGIKLEALRARLRRGMTLEAALREPRMRPGLRPRL